MKQTKMSSLVMILVLCSYAGLQFQLSMRQALQAQRALMNNIPYVGLVVAKHDPAPPDQQQSLHLLAEKSPSGPAEPVILRVPARHFDEPASLQPGTSLDMLYNPQSKESVERKLVQKQTHWTYWLFK